MILGMEPQVATAPAPPKVTFGQVEAILKDVPVDLLPEVYEYLASLVASTVEIPNEETRAAMDDVRAGRLQHFPTVEALFEHIHAEED
jgi:hypothetical protein